MIEVVSHGFWTLETVDAFVVDMDRAVAACRARARYLSLKVSSSTVQTQSAEVSARTVDSWRSWIGRPGDRAAIIPGTALATMQSRRLFESEQSRLFDNEATADAWLAEDR